MLLCKQEEAGIQLNAEQADWKDDTDDESDDQELEAHYMYMAKLQQNDEDVNLAKERELLASLIAKLKCEIDESKNLYHPQNHPTHYTQNSSTRPQQAATRNREKAIVNSPQPIYDQEPSMVAEDDE
nr:hypothetical protein [Tanacetum cinerariifolium]